MPNQVEVVIDFNASKPQRVVSEVESSAPTATLTSASGSNASVPVRLPSVVESTVNTDPPPPESALGQNLV